MSSEAVLSADHRPAPRYVEDVIRAAVVLTMFWGIVAFSAGVVIAAQLVWPQLSFDSEYLTFGRLRPLHTSAAIFAFGGTALIGTAFHVVQRTCHTRLFGGAPLGWFVLLGYQLFIVVAATGYLMGITQSKEYAEPEWYADLWLTIVWVA
jgi:cytochrome c oxidase cbb3-type subunit 1